MIKDWSRPAGSFANAESWGAKTVSDGAELRVVTHTGDRGRGHDRLQLRYGWPRHADGQLRRGSELGWRHSQRRAPRPPRQARSWSRSYSQRRNSRRSWSLLLVAGAAADVVSDDEEEPELHAVSAATAAASTPTDTAIPRRMITAIPSESGPLKVGTTSPPSPFHSHGAMTRARMLPVRNHGMPFVLISGGTLPRRTDLAF